MTAAEIINILGLTPLPGEGGWFCRTYQSAETLAGQALPERYTQERALATAIYYLITPQSYSALHRLPGDEIFHFYLGDPARQLQLLPDGQSRLIDIGPDILAGQRPQAVVPAGAWQACFLAPGGRWALLGTTNAPGFDEADLSLPGPDEEAELVKRWPEQAALIANLMPR